MGSALATGGFGYILRPGTAYASVCGDGASCTSGWTAFCCTVHGSNTCPPGSFPGGWWKIDASPFCSGNARYIVDCNATCPTRCTCTCATGTCDERRVCCNQFRYGQCNTGIACAGPVVCRVALCTPPWVWDPACTTTSRTDNRTLTHNAPCLIAAPPPPQEDELFKPQAQPTAHISAAHSGLVWDLPGLGRQGDRVGTYFSDGGIDQRWRIVSLPGGEVSFLTLDGSLALDIPDGNAFPGAFLRVWSINGSPAQRFLFEEVEPQERRIVHPASGLRLDVRDAGGPGALIQLWDPVDVKNQVFRFVPTV